MAERAKFTTYDLKAGTVTEDTRPLTPEEAAQRAYDDELSRW
jgi:hypothetical protein